MCQRKLSKDNFKNYTKHTELNENENTTYQSMCSTTEVVKRVNLLSDTS